MWVYYVHVAPNLQELFMAKGHNGARFFLIWSFIDSISLLFWSESIKSVECNVISLLLLDIWEYETEGSTSITWGLTVFGFDWTIFYK